MGIVVPVGEFQCVIRWALAGDLEPMVSTIGLRSSNGLTALGAAETITEGLVTSGGPCHAGAMVTGWSFLGVTAYQRTPEGFLVGEHNETVNGIKGGSTVPPNCAQLVTKVTGLGGRRNRGRMYVPPFADAETNISNTGVLLNLSGLQVLWDFFYDTVIADPGVSTFVLFHSDGTPSTPITGLRVESVMATQRKRMRP